MPWRSDIPHKQQARGGYPGLQEMMAFSLKDRDYSPASTNLFTIHLVTPALLKNWNAALGHNSSIGYNDATFMPDASDKLGKCLNFYCQTISIPSKQVTTGSLVNIGTATKYATGSAFSQISATFIAPKSQHSRNFFERWIQMMAPDSNQYSDYYDYYNAPRMMIFKWEKGGEREEPRTFETRNRNAKIEGWNANDRHPQKAFNYKLTASWEMQQVFPYNLGSTQLNNSANRAMTFTVGFFFERYRFYTASQFDEPGVRTQISIPGMGSRDDDYYDPLVDAQQIFGSVDATQKSLGIW
tara:strand:- start:504 stop:1397 length:894 start_codon:yes stop_codon:yes gene_type:complete